MKDMSYRAVMARQNEIMRQSLGINYDDYERGGIVFDYEAMMRDIGISIDEVVAIQRELGVGDTPLLEVKNITALARKIAEPGFGARILIKDEAANPSGSFKARRAALSVWDAKRKGYKGVIAATSGNYGAAVASMAAKLGLKCIVIQECFDSELVGQPEILEKQRKCEALGTRFSSWRRLDFITRLSIRLPRSRVLKHSDMKSRASAAKITICFPMSSSRHRRGAATSPVRREVC